jgi:DNA-binding NarL/FixJ family response regulator/class 3 adenylate cyclase
MRAVVVPWDDWQVTRIIPSGERRSTITQPSAMQASFVTILFTDLVGAAALFERHGDDDADVLRREHFARLRAAIVAHDGREIKSTGEGLIVAFTSAAAAVRCAVEMQRETSGTVGGLQARIGIDAGEPLADGDDLYGTTVIVARHLCDAAGDGEVLASEVVRRVAGPRVSTIMRPAGALRLKGLSEVVSIATVHWREDSGEQTAPPEPEAAARPITVVIADDQRLLRAGFRVILDAEPDIKVIGEAQDGRAAVDIVTRRRPDVALLDIRMPELDGLAAAERILSDQSLATAVVMLTTFDISEYIYEALRIGASGFLLKDTPADRLLDAVRVAAAGDALIAPSITRRLIAQFARAARPHHSGTPPELAELTARELDVLRLIARGLSNTEIAERLILGENTIKTHVGRIFSKLGLRDRVQAVVLGYETGLVERELSPGSSEHT